MASASEASLESKTVRKYFNDLVTVIQNPLPLTVALYSEDFVSQHILQRIRDVPATKDEKVTVLLSAVIDHISVHPEKFDELLTILSKDPPLTPLVERMRRTHSSLQTEQLRKEAQRTQGWWSKLKRALTPRRWRQRQPSPQLHHQVEQSIADRPMSPHQTPAPQLIMSTPHDQQAIPPHPVVQGPSHHFSRHTQRYSSYLKSYYNNMKPPQSFKWPFDIPTNEYINLALIQEDELTMSRSEFTKATIHGNIDDIMDRTKSQLDLHQVAQPKPDGVLPKCVLVVGAPGAGKSTFAWELSRKWGKGELLQQYSLVMLLRIRDSRVQEAKCLKDLLYSCKEEIRPSVIDEIEINNGRGVLLLFEGYDELSSGKRSENGVFERAMRGELLPEATVLITTRPSASYYVRRQCSWRIDQHIEILGFSKANIQSFVESAMGENQPMLDNFNRYLSCYPHIHSAMYIPLQSAIVVQVYSTVWQEGGDIVPKTMTGLYTSLAHSLLLRYLYDHPEYGKQYSRLRSFKDLPTDVYKNLVKLSKLAYEGMMEDVVIFSDLPAGVETFGVMQSVTELYVDVGAVVSYAYCHLTLQEYLAAYHLSLQSGEEQIQAIKTHRVNERMNIMLRFLAGLTKFKDIPPTSLQDLTAPCHWLDVHGRQVELDYLHMLFEVQDREVIESILGKYKVKFSSKLILYDHYVLGYCVANSNSEWHLFQSFTNTDNEALEMLIRGVTVDSTNCTGYIGELCLGGCNPSSSGLRSLLSCHISKRMRYLSLTKNDLDSEACIVLSKCILNLTELEELRLDDNPHLASGGIQQLVNSLLLHDGVKSLHLKNTGLCDCRPLPELMISSRTLKVLKVGKNNLSSQNVQLILTALPASTLTELNMSESQFSPQNTASLVSLRNNITLQYLNISKCNIDPQGACQLAEAMSENTVMEYLILYGNPIGERGAAALAQMLQRNGTLESMVVYDSSIGEEGTCKLINSLHNNSTLSKLRLPVAYESIVTRTLTIEVQNRIWWQ